MFPKSIISSTTIIVPSNSPVQTCFLLHIAILPIIHTIKQNLDSSSFYTKYTTPIIGLHCLIKQQRSMYMIYRYSTTNQSAIYQRNVPKANRLIHLCYKIRSEKCIFYMWYQGPMGMRTKYTKIYSSYILLQHTVMKLNKVKQQTVSGFEATQTSPFQFN